jgi:hypothetical protein
MRDLGRIHDFVIDYNKNNQNYFHHAQIILVNSATYEGTKLSNLQTGCYGCTKYRGK